MSATETTQTNTAQPVDIVLKRAMRRKKKAEGRTKRSLKLKTDQAFAKAFHEAKSKRANEKKSAFRKKKNKKK